MTELLSQAYSKEKGLFHCPPWMKVLAPEDLLRRLERNVLLSSMGHRDLPERQQTMTATVAWSYQLLQPHEQHVFRRLGALPHQFTMTGAAAVVAGTSPAGAADTIDAVIGAVAGLIDKSLLQRVDTGSGERPLYGMLETVRAYASLELAAAGERDEAMDGLARYCVDEAGLAGQSLVGPRQAEWLHRVRDDLENHRRALTWLLEHERVHEACEIGGCFSSGSSAGMPSRGFAGTSRFSTTGRFPQRTNRVRWSAPA